MGGPLGLASRPPSKKSKNPKSKNAQTHACCATSQAPPRAKTARKIVSAHLQSSARPISASKRPPPKSSQNSWVGMCQAENGDFRGSISRRSRGLAGSNLTSNICSPRPCYLSILSGAALLHAEIWPPENRQNRLFSLFAVFPPKRQNRQIGPSTATHGSACWRSAHLPG